MGRDARLTDGEPTKFFPGGIERAAMAGFKRKEYRGYRIEAVLPDQNGWRVTVFRLSVERPAPLRPSDIRHTSADNALEAGRREVDWLLEPPAGPLIDRAGSREGRPRA